MAKKLPKISFNAPVVLTFSFLCLAALLLGWLTKGWTTAALFSTYRSSLLSPLTYVRAFGHVLGHADWAHFFGNMSLFLVLGPMLEEKYGSWNLVFVILSTALVTSLVNAIFFPQSAVLGASGVVFAFILLASFTSFKDGEIPLTFILVAVIYIGGEIYSGLFQRDQISQLGHILGGGVGGVIGYLLNRRRNAEV